MLAGNRFGSFGVGEAASLLNVEYIIYRTYFHVFFAIAEWQLAVSFDRPLFGKCRGRGDTSSSCWAYISSIVNGHTSDRADVASQCTTDIWSDCFSYQLYVPIVCCIDIQQDSR